MTSLLPSSLQSRPSFVFYGNLPRGGEGRASPVIQGPFRSPKRAGTRTQRPLDTSWITPSREDESRSRRECFEKHAKRVDYSYQKIFSEGEKVAAGYANLELGAEKPNKSSRNNSYVRSILRVLGFGQAANRGWMDIQWCSGCYKVHTTSFTICQGEHVLVPSGQ